MKRILFILAVCLSLNGMTQEKTYTVSWRVAYEITDPCPDVPRMDKFGRLSGGMIGCLVHHCHIEYGHKSKEFIKRELAFNFYNEALQEQSLYFNMFVTTDGSIDSVRIDSILIINENVSLLNMNLTDTLCVDGTIGIGNGGHDVDSLLFITGTSWQYTSFDKIIWFSHFKDYIESCKDTITAVACGNGEFTIRDSEIVTSSQMKKRGYDFYREYIPIGDVFDIKYIFVKEPTLMGFYDWLKDE